MISFTRYISSYYGVLFIQKLGEALVLSYATMEVVFGSHAVGFLAYVVMINNGKGLSL